MSRETYTKTSQKLNNDSTKPKRYAATMLPEDWEFINEIRRQAGLEQWRMFREMANCVRKNPKVFIELSKKVSG